MGSGTVTCKLQRSLVQLRGSALSRPLDSSCPCWLDTLRLWQSWGSGTDGNLGRLLAPSAPAGFRWYPCRGPTQGDWTPQNQVTLYLSLLPLAAASVHCWILLQHSLIFEGPCSSEMRCGSSRCYRFLSCSEEFNSGSQRGFSEGEERTLFSKCLQNIERFHSFLM